MKCRTTGNRALIGEGGGGMGRDGEEGKELSETYLLYWD
jgi:hypothetical protein